MRPRRIAAYVTALLALVSFARAASLFLESVAEERAEREADAELLRLCRSGDARGSAKMREACLKAASDQASPVVLKAITRSVRTAWLEFRETVSSPLGLASVLLFLLSSMVLPVIPFLKAVAAAFGNEDRDPIGDDGNGDLERHVIVLNGGVGMPPRLGVRKRVMRALRGGGVRDDDDIGRVRGEPTIVETPCHF